MDVPSAKVDVKETLEQFVGDQGDTELGRTAQHASCQKRNNNKQQSRNGSIGKHMSTSENRLYARSSDNNTGNANDVSQTRQLNRT